MEEKPDVEVWALFLPIRWRIKKKKPYDTHTARALVNRHRPPGPTCNFTITENPLSGSL